MFNPEKTDYPANAAGEPEFASIIITVDGVSNDPELGDDVVQKIVLSTQDSVTALSKLAAYFGEPELLSRPDNGKLLVESGRQDNPVFVYTTPRHGTIQIITSTPTWDMLVQNPDFGRSSALLACDKLQQIVGQVQENMQQFAGGFANLLLLDLSPDKFDTKASASSEGGDGADAQHIAENSEFENVGDQREGVVDA